MRRHHALADGRAVALVFIHILSQKKLKFPLYF